jgi:AcrR family transcriptional regulator
MSGTRSAAGARVGRPTVADQRRRQIVEAFIRLIAAKGLERVGLDEVAAAAGVRRPALRHFVGNRRELIEVTVAELCRRYEATIRGLAPGTPRAEQLVRALFSDDWVHGGADEDLVFNALLHEAARNEGTAGEIRRAYDVLLAEIESALRRDYPGAPSSEVRDAAYAITCLVEHNATMQHIGYPRARSAGTLAAALRIAHRLGASP